MKLVTLLVLFTSFVGVNAASGDCPDNIPPINVNLDTVFDSYGQLEYTDFEWTFSPTALVNQPPSGTSACTTAGYISQYVPQGSCNFAITSIAAPPSRQDDTCVYTYSDGLQITMTLTLSCDESATSLQVDGPAVVTQTAAGWPFGHRSYYAFNGSYAGVCSTATIEDEAAAGPVATYSVWTIVALLAIVAAIVNASVALVIFVARRKRTASQEAGEKAIPMGVHAQP
eukprot:GILI01018209.1.p1 GENE.GILI01018209.1~~GILI01018209.1.p1  ORF type:complete len:240 (+),score=43.02 GILI01018209.1:38-721(+)